MNESYHLGIQLGRLSPRPWPGLKRFPFNTWKDEFFLAADIGYSTIEWIFDDERFEENPLWTQEGRKSILRASEQSGVIVGSVCADYFLKHPFFRGSLDEQEQGLNLFKSFLKNASEVGAQYVVLPLLEESSLENNTEKKRCIDALRKCDLLLKRLNIKVGIESVLAADDERELLYEIDSNHTGLVYDVGNHTSCEHDCVQDITELFDLILSVHIKDRLFRGSSVFLGTGDADFFSIVDLLKKKSFMGDFIMEAYFEDDPTGTAKNNFDFLKALLKGDCA